MYRLLGFCLGSIASVSALMFLVGWPDFHLSGDAADSERFDMAVQKLKAKQLSAEPATPGTELPQPATEPASNESIAESEAVAIVSDIDAPPTADGLEQAATAGVPVAPIADYGADNGSLPEVPPVEAWHTIWTPFRSRIAANGFVSRLESVTGLDYRVVQVDTGVYEVAFAYADQAELDTNLARISAATGLDLGANPP